MCSGLQVEESRVRYASFVFVEQELEGGDQAPKILVGSEVAEDQVDWSAIDEDLTMRLANVGGWSEIG